MRHRCVYRRHIVVVDSSNADAKGRYGDVLRCNGTVCPDIPVGLTDQIGERVSPGEPISWGVGKRTIAMESADRTMLRQHRGRETIAGTPSTVEG